MNNVINLDFSTWRFTFLCGMHHFFAGEDRAGEAYSTSGCFSTCVDYVNNHLVMFKFARFRLYLFMSAAKQGGKNREGSTPEPPWGQTVPPTLEI
ncbi:hypothetical protein L210DRAFT_2857638 [Boletus edulis BED1]|uniref:Uncharacterized protein n=1 Tax=Boletus edulis BED1 TaxID=1328754 RepID=A0AAD4G9D6_BOLED|nr:hypothetical protein L210DRAFT_2857638 [Boletus edulis BED1]